MKIIVFDTETVSINKPFCYDVGYVIVDTDTDEIVERKNFLVEQVWHNLPLFQTAYYADKRNTYVSMLKGRKLSIKKWGFIMRIMRNDILRHEVSCGYAYNSNFDEKVFDFCCNWFKTINPLEEIPIFDIRGNVHQFLIDDNYKLFCKENEYYTESGAFSSTAETVYRYITKLTNWDEAHTALDDSEIEAEILRYTIDKGAEYGKSYETFRSLGKPKIAKTITVYTNSEPIVKYGVKKGKKVYNREISFENIEDVKFSKDKDEIELR